MIEVFKTNVQEVEDSLLLIQKLLEHFPQSRINFDLEDCDRILRIDEAQLCVEKVVMLLKTHGFVCEVLL